jgi:flavin-dependent dehydrogenase
MPSIFSPYGNGWHLDRRRFECDLAARAVAAGATRRCGRRVSSVARNGRTWNLQLDDGTVVDCTFLIDATGRASWLSRRLGARRVHHDRLIATVAFLDGGHCDSTTLIEAAADGWWYSAPLPDSRLAVMLISDTPRPWAPAQLTRA